MSEPSCISRRRDYAACRLRFGSSGAFSLKSSTQRLSQSERRKVKGDQLLFLLYFAFCCLLLVRSQQQCVRSATVKKYCCETVNHRLIYGFDATASSCDLFDEIYGWIPIAGHKSVKLGSTKKRKKFAMSDVLRFG